MASSNDEVSLMNKARESATFHSSLLARVIHDDDETISSRRAAFHRVESALDLTDNMKLPALYNGADREDQYVAGLRRGRVVMDDMLEHKHQHFECITERYQLSISTTFGLHFLMFRKTVELQGTPEQQRYWLPLIDELKITGAYGQTELGHGSFVRGIETTATFDVATDEMIIHSPTLTATKYWPGGLGMTCSHAVVVARLITGGTDYGPHMFIVKLRSLEDFRPVEGVELGDIGIKMTSNGTCNGYAAFTHVRVPRDSLLGANAQVMRDGSYKRSGEGGSETGHMKKTYATLLYVRGVIARQVGFSLAQAVTIAARYSVVRLQGYGMFAESETNAETATLAFKSQHYRLLTLLSQAYAILFVSKDFDRLYNILAEDRASGDYKRLPYTHAVSTGLKAWTTNIAAAGVEDARRLTGGHGCMALAGFQEIVGAVGASVTYEGENYVMWQQLGRFLFKQLEARQAGKPVAPEMETVLGGEAFEPYLQDQDDKPVRPCQATGDQLDDPSTLQAIFLHRARRLLVSAHRFFKRQLQTKKNAAIVDAWNASLMPMTAAASAFIEYFVLRSFQERAAATALTEPNVAPVLERLSRLFAHTTIVSPTVSAFNAASFVEDGFLSLRQLDHMRTSIDDTMDQIMPDVIALTDAWDFTDASLASALGCRDGNVYERLMSWTRQLPVNVHTAQQGGLLQRGWDGPDGLKQIMHRGRPIEKATNGSQLNGS